MDNPSIYSQTTGVDDVWQNCVDTNLNHEGIERTRKCLFTLSVCRNTSPGNISIVIELLRIAQLYTKISHQITDIGNQVLRSS